MLPKYLSLFSVLYYLRTLPNTFFLNLNPFICGYEESAHLTWKGLSYRLSPVCAAPHLPCSGHCALNLLLCLSPQKITPISQLRVTFFWEIGQK